MPDKDKAPVYYALEYGVSLEKASEWKNSLRNIYADGSYWHDMEKIKKECEEILREIYGESAKWQISIEDIYHLYRSSIHIVVDKANQVI